MSSSVGPEQVGRALFSFAVPEGVDLDWSAPGSFVGEQVEVLRAVVASRSGVPVSDVRVECGGVGASRRVLLHFWWVWPVSMSLDRI